MVGRRNAPVVGRRDALQAHDMLWWRPAPRPHQGTKKSPPIVVAERTYLTKRPYKCQKKAVEPAAGPAPTAAPAPAPLVRVDGAAARASAEKKPPTVLPPVPAVASVPFLLDKPIHASGILFKIIGMMDDGELPGPLVRGAQVLQ